MESRTPLLRSPEPPLPPKELDDAIEAVGADRAVVLPLALIVGLTWCADSIEISLLAFLYECVGAAFDLTSAQADTAVAVVFAGELVGALAFGLAADAFGRRPTTLCATATIACFGVLSAGARHYADFVALQFFVGVGIGGLAVPFDLLVQTAHICSGQN